MLENTLELTNASLACSSSSLELSPKENLSSSSSTSSRSGSFCLQNYKSKIKKFKQRRNLILSSNIISNNKNKLLSCSLLLKKKLKRVSNLNVNNNNNNNINIKKNIKLNRYTSLSSASSTSSSTSNSPLDSTNHHQSDSLINPNSTDDSNTNKLINRNTKKKKKPMKLHKFYHSVPFKCPFCFTFKEIPSEFIDHLTSIHFSDVKLIYEKKCTKLIEQAEQINNQKNEDDELKMIDNCSYEIPTKFRKMMNEYLEEDDEDEDEHSVHDDEIEDDEDDENEKENLNDCLSETEKNSDLDKEQEIHTPPKTPPVSLEQTDLLQLNNNQDNLDTSSSLSSSSSSSKNQNSNQIQKSTYLQMNSSVLPPRKQQRLLKSPFDCDESNQNDKSTNNAQKLKSSFSVPSLLSSSSSSSSPNDQQAPSITNPFLNINNLAVAAAHAASILNQQNQLNRQPSVQLSSALNTTNISNNNQQEASMKCAICDRGFEYYSNLRRHIKTKHKIYGKQVKEYVIRHSNNNITNNNQFQQFRSKQNDSNSSLVNNNNNNNNKQNDNINNMLLSSTNYSNMNLNGDISPMSFGNKFQRKLKNNCNEIDKNNESLDEDMDQAEIASSTSTSSSSFSSSQNSSPTIQQQTQPQTNLIGAQQQQQQLQQQHQSSSNKFFSSLALNPQLTNSSNNLVAVLAAASQLPPNMMNINQQQMLAFLNHHTNAMSKIKSSLLESLLTRKLPNKFSDQDIIGCENDIQQTTQMSAAEASLNQNILSASLSSSFDSLSSSSIQSSSPLNTNKMSNFSKLIQNIVELNQNANLIKTEQDELNVTATSTKITNTKNSENDQDNSINDETENMNDSITKNNEQSSQSSTQSVKRRFNRRYNNTASNQSAFYPLNSKQKLDEDSDIDLYEDEENRNDDSNTNEINNNNKKEETSFCDYDDGDLDQDKHNQNENEEDYEENDDDLRSRTSSSRSYESSSISLQQSTVFNHLTPSNTPNKFLFNNQSPTPNQLNQFMLETHLRTLTQQNFNHHYQTYQQNLQRNFGLAAAAATAGQFLNPVNAQQSILAQQTNQTPPPQVPPVPPSSGMRRKRSKDFSINPTNLTSSMVASMRNLQCSPSNSSVDNGSTNNSMLMGQTSNNNSANNNQIRFSTEIWRCPYCCYETTSASRYNSHLVCHGWKPYLCPHCGSRSNRLPDMRTHISTFHPEFNVNTFVVLSEEEAKSTLKDYMKNRALINRKLKEMRPQPKFKCKLCPYASLYQFNLTKHVKSVHLSEVYHQNNNNNQNKDS